MTGVLTTRSCEHSETYKEEYHVEYMDYMEYMEYHMKSTTMETEIGVMNLQTKEPQG